MKNSITSKTKILAVIGDPIEHSMSPSMHNAAIDKLGLNFTYVAYHVLPKNLERAVDGFRALDIKGINVTIPHKVTIMQYLDEIEQTAKNLGAINTIKNENGYLRAKNTDGEGSLKAIKDKGFNPKNKKAIMIGAGGAARAIAFYLLNELDELVIVNRDEDFHLAEDLKENLQKFYDNSISTIKTSNYGEVKSQIEESDLLINCTPVGMHPKIEATPVQKDFLHSNLFVFDAIYNPLKTQLIKDAEALGCKTESGIQMFVNQGWLAFKWWTGKEPDEKLMKDIVIQKLGLE